MATKAERKAKRKEGLNQVVNATKNFHEENLKFWDKASITKPISTAVRGVVNTVKNIGNTKDTLVGLAKVLFNHDSWYTNSRLNKLVNLNYGRRKSVNNKIFDMMNLSSLSGDTVVDESTTVAVMEMELAIPQDKLHSFYQAISIMYAKIRSANSGATNFSIHDLAAYVLNVRSVRVALNQLRRSLALCYYSNPYDADLPRILVNASNDCEDQGGVNNGIRYEMMVSHAADIQNLLKVYYQAVRNLLPLNIDLLARADWLASNVFCDSNDAKCNYIVPTFGVVPIYSVLNTNDGIGRTGEVDLALGAPYTDEQIYEKTMEDLSTFISSMVADTKNTIIAGDILKAFGSEQFFNQDAFDIGVACVPVYDEEALSQFQSANPAGMFVTACAEWAKPDQSDLKYTHVANGKAGGTLWTAQAKSLASNPNFIVNANKDEISEAETIKYTRLITVPEDIDFGSSSTPAVFHYLYNGSEFVRNVKYIYGWSTYGVPQTIGFNNLIVADGTGTLNSVTQMRILQCWSIVKAQPAVFFRSSVGTTLLFDFNNFALASKEDISTTHEIATLSLLSVKDYVKKSNEFKYLG